MRSAQYLCALSFLSNLSSLPLKPLPSLLVDKRKTVSDTLALIHLSLLLWLGLSVCFYVCASMIPTYRHSVSNSFMPLDLNEDQNHELFTPNNTVSSSFSSISYPIFFNPPHQDQKVSYYEEPKHLPSDEEAEKIILSCGPWDHSAEEKLASSSEPKLTVWKKEERDENFQAAEDGSVKWMSSKMRMMRKMMVSDQNGSDIAGTSMQKFEDQKQPLSPLGTDNSSNNYSNHSNNTVRVCSDCHTTKTPLWRSGPRGPKSLCNACGIRQRKARRAMAAAAAASASGIFAAAETSVKGNKLQKKGKKSKVECAPQMKKKRKLRTKPSQSREKFGFEDFTLSLSNNIALHQVFPQDEKEAAILLMALSYGLVHG